MFMLIKLELKTDHWDGAENQGGLEAG